MNYVFKLISCPENEVFQISVNHYLNREWAIQLEINQWNFSYAAEWNLSTRPRNWQVFKTDICSCGIAAKKSSKTKSKHSVEEKGIRAWFLLATFFSPHLLVSLHFELLWHSVSHLRRPPKNRSFVMLMWSLSDLRSRRERMKVSFVEESGLDMNWCWCLNALCMSSALMLVSASY